MSTPDNNEQAHPADEASEGGVNAYKLKRRSLAAPAAPGALPQGAVPPAAPSPTTAAAAATRGRRPAARGPIALGLVLALAVGVAAALILRRDRPPALTREAAGVSAEVAASQEAGSGSAIMPDYRALVIGINDYHAADGTGWHPLNSARADAEDVAKILAGEYGFSVQSLLDQQASRAAILNALDELATSGADGADLIYFAGHGYFDEKLNEGYWIPADARRQVQGRDAKEDWLWNSTITRLIGASRARHVLVMSDACYSGALFRGDRPLQARSGQAWYERAIVKPSRYLITSGGIEPVLDSGVGHSVFAQQIINYLRHEGRDMFSANDLGSALRERVAALTGQMVQMGPLPVSGHAGGEFVFIRKQSGVRLAAATLPDTGEDGADTNAWAGAAGTETRQERLRGAAELLQAGAPQAARNLVAGLLDENAQDPVARALADSMARLRRQDARDDLQQLISQLEGKGGMAGQAPDVRPRVLACLGPALAAGGSPVAEGIARLYRIVLGAELGKQAGMQVIEREALTALLEEQRLGVSDLADPQARLAIGRLLPASLLLLGDVIIDQAGVETLYLRLADTETTQVVGSFTAARQAEEDVQAVCARLAGEIAARVEAVRPLPVAAPGP